MSAKDKRGSNSAPKGANAKPPPGDGATFSAALTKILNDLDGLRKDRDGLQEYGSLSDALAARDQELLRKDEELKKMRKELDELAQKKDAIINNLEETLDEREIGAQELVRTFENRFSEWKTKQEQHDKDLAELAKLRDENGKLKRTVDENSRRLKELDSLRRQAKEHEKKAQELNLNIRQRELDLENMSNQLELKSDALREANEAIGLLPWDKKKAEQGFASLSSRLHQLVWEYFYKQVDEPRVFPQIPWDIPKVQSNSEAAKYMRCAGAEAIISQELARRIFRDFYITESLGVTERPFIDITHRLNANNKTEARVICLQLAKASQSNSVVKDISQRAARTICKILSCWLDDGARKAKLESDLQAIFAEAIEMWQPLQRIQEWAWPYIDTVAEHWVDRQREEYDLVKLGEEHSNKQRPTFNPGKPLAILFPQIVVDSECIFQGFALFPTQSAVIAATMEIEDNGQKTSSSASPRLRRASVPNPGVPLRGGADWDLANGSEIHGMHGSSILTGSDLSYSGRVARSQSMRERGESTPTGSGLGH